MSSDEGKTESQHIGTVPKQSFGSRLKAHFKRFWWIHLIVFIIVFLVILLPVYVSHLPSSATSNAIAIAILIQHS